ncbi:MAG: biotin/lipoyl-containing protein, partial [Micrococcales bacterium]
LQRRHQKLVEEAPAPFLSDDQIKRLYESSKAILKEVGYQGAGTCEFLVALDGTISFLEVNTRLQVEHPVSEEVTGLDLVREQFRLAEGGKLDYSDPVIKGHSFEFRINGEDAGRNFMPAPGNVKLFKAPSGPGVRVDTGVESGDVISGSFDSMIAKLIVTGSSREEALARSRRALAEMQVEGMPTVLPFHKKIVNDPAFIGSNGKFGIYTRWIETEWNNDIPAFDSEAEELAGPATRNTVVVEVGGKRIEVTLPAHLASHSHGSAAAAPATQKRAKKAAANTATGNAIKAPMQSTVVKINVQIGDEIAQGDLVVVLEAMKMEQPLTSHKAGKIKSIGAAVGETVSAGTVLLEFED